MKDELKVTVRSITPKFLLFYIVGSVVLLVIFGFSPFSYWGSGFGAALNAIDLSASLFTLGAPFVMGAALLLPSFKLSKDDITETNENLNARFLTISRFLVLFFLSVVFMISWILLSYFLALQDYLHLSSDLILVYLPGTIVSGLIMTILLSAVTTFIATIMDDWKLALIANLGLFYILGMTLGCTSYLHSYDSLAIFGPYHLFRFLSLFLSSNIIDPVFGIVWGDPTMMNMILGIDFGFMETIFSLGLWIALSIILLFITQYAMKQNLSCLKIKNELDRFTPDDQKLLKQLKEVKQVLKQRRLVLGTVLVIMFIVLPLFRSSLRSAIIDDSTTTLYESPPDGEMLALGSWVYGEAEVPSPPGGLNTMYQIRVEILDWGDCPDVIERWVIFDNISIAYFEALNNTEKDDLIRRRSLDIRQDDTIIGSGFSSIQTTGTHLWAFKFVPAEGYPLQGIMHIRITIVVRAD
ncbi:hypothetical protein E4H12_13675 [Candidatus Thorarchaeota archaeon]|nr:MAG: hypothetical protein E4H12_13675 [Candidatus Thorarchaeota archaeon]